MTEIEYELTYLAKFIPAELSRLKPKRVTDYYLPEANREHPHLRIRAKGGVYEITSKQPVDEGDSSEQAEHTIILDKAEYDDLVAGKSRVVAKDRYKLTINGHPAEIDVFVGKLAGLVLIDFEFASKQHKDAFVAPNICFADVTQEEFIAGGMLAGKSYADIEPYLRKYNYKKLVPPAP